MAYFKNMDIVNTTALPMVPLDVGRPPCGRKNLADHMPSCLVGSIHQVNTRIAEVDLTPKPLDNILAFERFVLKKKALKEKRHHISEDRDRSQRKSPEVCSGSSSRSVRAISIKRKTADKKLLAELYQYPQFNDSMPNELPNGVEFCDMVANVVRSERCSFSVRFFCSHKGLEKFLSSPPIRAIWLDSFWWIFHERYHQNREVQNKLFDRIAQRYALLLLDGSRPQYEEYIFKRLPLLLSKGLYTSFSCSFPQSWLNTHEFKSSICNTISLWISGIYPSPLSYESWDYSNLDPERFWREGSALRRYQKKGKEMSFFIPKMHSSSKSVHSRKIPHPQPTDGHPDSKRDSEDTVQSQTTTKDHYQTPVSRRSIQMRKISEARIAESTLPKKAVPAGNRRREFLAEGSTSLLVRKRMLTASTHLSTFTKHVREKAKACLQSHPACKIPPMTLNRFNIYGKSPLVVYYLLNYATMQQSGQDVLITRREITKTIPESSLTYADVINLTLCHMKKRKDNLMQLIEFRCSEWTYFDQYLGELQDNFLRDIKALDQREADKRRANRTFIPSSASIEEIVEKKHKKDLDREIEFLLRREKDEEEKHKWIHYALPLPSHNESSSDDSDDSDFRNNHSGPAPTEIITETDLQLDGLNNEIFQRDQRAGSNAGNNSLLSLAKLEESLSKRERAE